MTFIRKKSKNDIFLPQKINQLSLQLHNLIATRSHEITTRLIKSNKKLSFQLTLGESYNTPISLNIRVWGEDSILCLSQWPLPKTLHEFISDKELAQLPKDLALITLSTAFEVLILTASQKLSSFIEINEFSLQNSETEDSQEPKLFFKFKVEDEPEIQASLTLNNKILSHLIDAIECIQPVSILSARKIEIPVFLEFGNSLITSQILYSASKGDILMIDSHIKQNKKKIRLRFLSKKTFFAKKTKTQYKLTEEKIMKNTEYEKDILIDDIPLNITFDIGQETIKLDKMEEIGVGYTLDIKRELSELVTLRIENKTIGHGELVNIGDRIGVRITQLNQN